MQNTKNIKNQIAALEAKIKAKKQAYCRSMGITFYQYYDENVEPLNEQLQKLKHQSY